MEELTGGFYPSKRSSSLPVRGRSVHRSSRAELSQNRVSTNAENTSEASMNTEIVFKKLFLIYRQVIKHLNHYAMNPSFEMCFRGAEGMRL